LCVSVPYNRKGEPMTLLAQASIGIRDFEILEEVKPIDTHNADHQLAESTTMQSESGGEQS
jgi:hypothetical protein